MIEKVIQLDTSKLRVDIVRAGCIPYVIIDGVIKYCLGLDSKENEFTDFGGGFSTRFDIIPQIAAIRELREESLDIFCYNLSDLAEFYCIHNDMSLIIFVEIPRQSFEETSLCNEFTMRKLQCQIRHKKVELSSIHFMTKEEISNIKIFDKIDFAISRLEEIEISLLRRSLDCFIQSMSR